LNGKDLALFCHAIHNLHSLGAVNHSPWWLFIETQDFGSW